MTQHTIQVSDAIYQLLVKRASIENSTLEQVAERLLAQKLTTLIESNDAQEPSTTEDEAQALAAVRRLTTLFADVNNIDRLEQLLDDPMLELMNADLAVGLL